MPPVLKVAAVHNEADIQTVEVTSFDHEHIAMEGKAKEVAQTLTNRYPNYPWCIGWAPGGVLVVKLMINQDFNYGYTIDTAKSFSASNLAKMAVDAGGELLERLGMRRGAWNGEMPTQTMEGVPLKKAAPLYNFNNVKGVIG